MRRAHTLMELLVVITLLSLVAAIAMPRLIVAMSRPRVNATVEALRDDLNFARARATATGLRHIFVLDRAGGEIQVQPYHPEDALLPQANQVQDVALQDRLPREVQVVSWEVMPMGIQSGTAPAPGSSSSDPLTFYPEGPGDGVRVILQDEHGTRGGLELDGYTGHIRILQGEELAGRY